MRFLHQKQIILHRYLNEINTVNQLFYQHTPIDTAIYEMFEGIADDHRDRLLAVPRNCPRQPSGRALYLLHY